MEEDEEEAEEPEKADTKVVRHISRQSPKQPPDHSHPIFQLPTEKTAQQHNQQTNMMENKIYNKEKERVRLSITLL